MWKDITTIFSCENGCFRGSVLCLFIFADELMVALTGLSLQKYPGFQTVCESSSVRKKGVLLVSVLKTECQINSLCLCDGDKCL